MSRCTVLSYQPLFASEIERLRKAHDVIQVDMNRPDGMASFLAALPRVQGMIGAGVHMTDAMLAQAPQLKVISSISVGVDYYPLADLHRRGILLCHTPGVLNEAVADLIFTMMLATSRRLFEMAQMVQQGRWTHALHADSYGWDVHGKTVGIIGYGRIGRAVARRAALGFDMPVIYHSRHPAESGLPEGKARAVSLDELLASADFVVVMVPLNDQTRGMIGAEALARMKPDAILINAARGPIVQEPALLDALDGGRLRAAGLDVFAKEPLPGDSRLRNHPRVLALPHMGSATQETRLAMARLAVDNLLRVLQGEAPLTPYETGAR